MSKADEYNVRQYAEGKLKPSHLTELTRDWQRHHGLDVDGFAGPVTIRSLDAASDGRPALPVERCYPMRALPDGRKPLVTSAYYTKNPSRANPDRPHRGVDFFYRYDGAVDPPVKIGDGGRDSKYWVPEDGVAVAVAAGRVCSSKFVGSSGTGHRAWIEHDGGYFSGYFHLRGLMVSPGEVVEMGAPIGVISHNPMDSDARHLHFEVYWGDLAAYPRGSFDPEVLLAGATVLPAR